MIIYNNVCLYRGYKNIAKKIAIICLVFLCSCSNVIWGKGENTDSLIQKAQILDSLAEYNYDQGNDSLALVLSKRCLNIQKTILGENHPDYAKTLCHIAQYYDELGYYQKAVDSITKAIGIQRKIVGTNNPDYAKSLSTYAGINSSIGNYKKAVDIGIEVLNINKDVYGEESKQYSYSLVELATYYYEMGNIQKSLSLFDLFFSIYNRNTWETKTPKFARALLEYAKIKSDIGYYKEAIEFGQEALGVYKLLYGEKHPLYAIALSCLGCFYSEGSYNCVESIRLEEKALEIYKEKNGIHHFNYANSLFNLAEYYRFIGNYDKAFSLVSEAKGIFESLFGKKSGYYISSLLHISEYYARQGLSEKATEIVKMAKEFVNEEAKETDNVDVGILFNIAECCYCLGDFLSALSYGEKAVSLQKELYSSDNLYYANITNIVSNYCAKKGLYDKAYKYEKESIDIYMNKVLNSFTSSSIAQSKFLWKGIQDRFLNYAGLFYRHPDTSLLSDLYNKSALFAKALLLNVDMEIRKTILESKDSVLIQKYLELSSNKGIYNKLTELPYEEHYMDIDSLKDIIQKQDEDLITMSKEYGDYMHNLKLTWKDIQHHLREKDVALEFLDFPIGTDSVMYVALIIRKDSEFPKMTILFEEKQLKHLSDTLYHHCKDLTDLIWGPLLSELKGINNVYFSPSGALYNIGIEYLPGMENYNIYRLSSTRELVTDRKTRERNSAVLYGGLDYYAKADTTNSVKNITALDKAYKEHTDVRSMGLRGGKEYLKHTKIEVDIIGEELNKAKWKCLLDTATLGTEESFKALSGKRTGCLHISTHGFYFTKEEAVNTGYSFLRLGDNTESAEDKALTRSGLIMSGANHILEGEPLPDNVEDGILTAKEIADVDLRGLDLVVLSACQTGLGDISQGEGVFGLQRGFKKAGANTILMSLWEVNDEATQILMTQFYKNLVAGISKRQSLQSAQNYLRMYKNEKGEQCYNEPKYWAAFILLDGIDKN